MIAIDLHDFRRELLTLQGVLTYEVSTDQAFVKSDIGYRR